MPCKCSIGNESAPKFYTLLKRRRRALQCSPSPRELVPVHTSPQILHLPHAATGPTSTASSDAAWRRATRQKASAPGQQGGSGQLHRGGRAMSNARGPGIALTPVKEQHQALRSLVPKCREPPAAWLPHLAPPCPTCTAPDRAPARRLRMRAASAGSHYINTSDKSYY